MNQSENSKQVMNILEIDMKFKKLAQILWEKKLLFVLLLCHTQGNFRSKVFVQQ